MNKFTKLLTAALSAFAVIGAASAASAYSGDLFTEIKMIPSDELHTVITDTEGASHTVDGAIDASAIEEFDNADKIASYEILSGNESILSVTLNDIIPEADIILAAEGTPMNGYYSVRFTLSDEDNTECFLTGLSPSNLNSVQSELISAELEGTIFEMESLDFIDTEKSDMPPDGESELCWAASAADMLKYTGWSAKAGFEGEDDIFDVYADSFTNVGGSQDYALEWFFNGVYQPQGHNGWAQVKDGYGEFSGYLPEYDADQIVLDSMCNHDHTVLNMTLGALENGGGIGIGLGWYTGGVRSGGHAITMWGYIYDRDLDTSDTEYCKAMIVSDSDSDIKSDANRRTAPNKLQVLNMSYCTDYGLDSWRFDDYYAGNGIIDDFVLCEPYSDSLPKETDADASMNKFTEPDFYFNEPCAASDEYDALNRAAEYVFADDKDIYFQPDINKHGKEFDGDIAYSVTVTNKADNSVVYENTLDYAVSSDYSLDDVLNIGRLDKGEYKAVFSVNPDKTQSEAYYYNNIAEYDFTVTDGVDASGVTLAASIGDFENGEAPVTLDIAGLETLGIPEGAELEYDVYAIYYINGQPDGSTSDVCGADSVPTEGITYAYGDGVVFRLKISDRENSFPVINIYSEEYPQSYAMLEAVSETGKLTPLDINAKKLADGEEIKFRIQNSSVGNADTDKYKVTVYADNGADERTELFSAEGDAPAIGETSDLISFDSWDAELSGTYDIIAEIEGFGEYRIGTLSVREAPSVEVTSDGDKTDEYDGVTTLREAVEYAAKSGGTVTIGNDIRTLMLNEPIDIDGDITIKSTEVIEDSQATMIVSANNTRLFNISESGSLTLNSLFVGYGTAVDYGGAIKNNGGRLTAESCMFLYSESGLSGGSIYSDGGEITLKNCSMYGNNSGYGGAIGIDGGAVVNALNCNFFRNEANSGAVYVNDGTFTAVYSTFTENTASSSGGGAVASNGSANLTGCILSGNNSADVSGNARLYGCCYGTIEKGAQTDSLSSAHRANEIFVTDVNGAPIWDADTSIPPHRTPLLSPLAGEGVYVKNNNGMINVSADNSEWFDIGVPSPFTDEEYSFDCLGAEHERLFGSYASFADYYEIQDADGERVMIYSPENADAELIISVYDESGKLTEVTVTPAALKIGTNTIYVAPPSNGEARYMLWRSLNSAEPLCDAF